MARSRMQRVVFQPGTYEGIQQGIKQIVDVVRPTLGPLPRIVAIDKLLSGKMPEILDDGGVIARRIIQLPDRDEDMGAMFVRHLLWRLHEKVGDGTATAAVLFQSIYDQGVRYITAGGNAMQLRRYLEKGRHVIDDELAGMALHLEGEEDLAKVAESICYDPPLARMLGEIFNIIGEYGRLEVRPGRTRELEREYVEGMYWESRPFSRQMLLDKSRLRTELENAAILIGDLEFEDPRHLMPVLRLVMQQKIPGLLILANKVSDSTNALIMSANREPEKFKVVAVEAPGKVMDDRAAAMQDLAVLTGGSFFARHAGQTLERVKLEDVGRARRVWVERFNFGIIGGQGDPRALRNHIANLRSAFEKAGDPDERKKLRERVGKLMGGSATLFVGANTELQVEERKELAKRTADALRGAIMEGVLPGGGVALLACRPALQKMLDQASDSDERAAYRILIRALEEPIRTIMTNAGYDASEIMGEIRMAGSGYGFDVRSGQTVDVVQAGIFDAASVLREVMRSAIAGAALALTVDVLVHHKDFDKKAAVGTA